jgi:hypothetical protein
MFEGNRNEYLGVNVSKLVQVIVSLKNTLCLFLINHTQLIMEIALGSTDGGSMLYKLLA